MVVVAAVVVAVEGGEEGRASRLSLLVLPLLLPLLLSLVVLPSPLSAPLFPLSSRNTMPVAAAVRAWWRATTPAGPTLLNARSSAIKPPWCGSAGPPGCGSAGKLGGVEAASGAVPGSAAPLADRSTVRCPPTDVTVVAAGASGGCRGGGSGMVGLAWLLSLLLLLLLLLLSLAPLPVIVRSWSRRYRLAFCCNPFAKFLRQNLNSAEGS